MPSGFLSPRQWFNGVFLTLLTAAKLMIIAMTALIGVTVFMRYVLGGGIRWANEMALFLQVWFTFIAMALGVRKRLHISIDVLPKNMNRWIDWSLERLKALVIAATGYVMLVYGTDLVESTMRSVLPATGIQSGYLYLAMPVGGALVMVEALLDLFGIDRRDSWLDRYMGEDEPISEDQVELAKAELKGEVSVLDSSTGASEERNNG